MNATEWARIDALALEYADVLGMNLEDFERWPKAKIQRAQEAWAKFGVPETHASLKNGDVLWIAAGPRKGSGGALVGQWDKRGWLYLVSIAGDKIMPPALLRRPSWFPPASWELKKEVANG
jgi:hypothetical protein